jgi:predicted DNA-binding transcriptional regulator AlpA
MTTLDPRADRSDAKSLPVDPLAGLLTLRLDELASALGVSRRAIERERSAGRFPRPDLTIGKMPLWQPESVRQWIERGGQR